MNDRSSVPQPEFTAYEPSEDLKAFVHRFMYGCSRAGDPVSITVFPTGGVFLSFVAGGPLRVRMQGKEAETRSRLFIGGQLRRERPVLGSDGDFRLLGVEFRPTAFYRLFHQNVDVFTDQMTEFAEAFPRIADDLENRLNPADSIDQLIAAMEGYLRSLLPQALETPVVETAVAKITERRGLITVDELATLTGYSARQLNRYFVTAVGIPPKHYAKIVQIHSVISAMQAGDTVLLQALSLEFGYFDHAHFIRDFQRLVQSNPTNFIRSKSAFLHTFLGNASH
jgi:AraC-like DNA-binding protein